MTISMSKLSMITKIAAAILLAASSLHASSDSELTDFVKNSIRKNKNVEIKDVTVASSIKKEELGGWEAVVVKIDLEVDKKKQSKYEILFRNGSLVSFDIIDLKSKRSIKDSFSPPLEESHYKKDRIIAGDKTGKAKHKIVVFSDPLCPFCLDTIPGIIAFVKEHPKDVSLYFYHLPLESLHPSAPTIIKAAVALEQNGYKDVVEKLYQAKFDIKVTDEEKVIKLFNDHFKSKLTKSDIDSESIKKHVHEDAQLANDLMVRGTPSVFIDGQKDNRNELLEKLKKKLK